MRLVSIAIGLVVLSVTLTPSANANDDNRAKFRRVPTQFIAALGEPNATAGDNAQTWGLWTVDPGPRGVRLQHYELLLADGGIAPAQWQFDRNDWWLEENGLIMEQPTFPLVPGRYIVTGNRETISMLTIHAADARGNMRWELDRGANLYDVTHLGCRSARYIPATANQSCSPSNAPQAAFRVAPGAEMPAVEGCAKQDYAVLFIIATEVDS